MKLPGLRLARFLSIDMRPSALVCVLIAGFALAAQATDWSAAERDLARKVVALTGSSAISIRFENRSSLARRDAEIIQNGLRGTLAAMGVRVAENDSTAAAVGITLSENVSSYVWVAQVQRAGSDPAVVIEQVPREVSGSPARESAPLSLHKILLWRQAEPILDVLVLEENARIAVLSPEKVSVYRTRGGNAQLEGEGEIPHSTPWPRDLRGRVVPANDHLLDVYMPGVVCHSSAGGPFALSCGPANDPWPLMIAGPGPGPSTQSAGRAYFEASRNFFTGVETSPGGWLKVVPQFYSTAFVPRDPAGLWLFAAVDGSVHMVEGSLDRATNLRWGSSMTSLRTSCGAGWQILATGPGDEAADSVRAYEIPERDPVPVSAEVDFPGSISALWADAKGDRAVTIARNVETGNYEAFRLALACGQ